MISQPFVSNPFEVKIVRTSLSSVEEIAVNEGAEITTVAGVIVVNAKDGAVFEIYTPAGLLVSRGEGHRTVPVASDFYIVRAGGVTAKAAVN